jgi:dephospho-CoA kinase
MLIVALTGGIATGKSLVAGKLRDLGCFIYSSDKAAHRLMRPRNKAWEAVVDRFGASILDSRNQIDRRRLGELAFSDEKERRFLDLLVHPLVLSDQRALIARLQREGRTRIFIAEAALTIEAGFIHRFHRVIVSYCPTYLQVERLMARDAIGRDEALRKIHTQLPVREKIRFADYLIDTSGAPKETLRQAGRIHRFLEMDFQARFSPEKNSTG